MEGQTPSAALELSVVLPCLNEVETLPGCLDRVRSALRTGGLTGEIIVADNGSTHGSPEAAAGLGAKVLHVPPRGYGNAVEAGVAVATAGE